MYICHKLTTTIFAVICTLLATELSSAWISFLRGLSLYTEVEPSTSNNYNDDDNYYHSLSRREALTRGLIVGGVAIAPTTLSITALADDTATVSTKTSKTSLLSDYNPLDYKTLGDGRTMFPPSFLPPLNNRATYRYNLGRNAYALEQLLAFQNVTATIRTNIIKLDDGGLWVCNPLWPTEEYCALLDELGVVKHVVLASNALEHKAAMKQFLSKYPNVEDVFISPGQYSVFGECGIVTDDMDKEQVDTIVKKASKTMGYRVDGILPVKVQQQEETQSKPANMFPSWSDAFDFEVLCLQLEGNAGPVSEVALFHKSSMSLIVTDAVICVPSVGDDSYPLQPIYSTYFDEDTTSDPTFWQRTVLQAVFLPLRSESLPNGDITYPGFDALGNKLSRAPILRAFNDARAPHKSRDWVNSITGLSFDRILTAHFASPINAGPALFKKAFAHLYDDASAEDLEYVPIPCQDWSTLDSINSFIDQNKLGAPVIYDFKRGCKE